MDGGTFRKLRKIIACIPPGEVTTYGVVAELAGIGDARTVGWAISGNQDPKVPCHRLVNRQGFLATNYSLGGWTEQKRRLEKEGIKFLKPNRVDLNRHLWVGKANGTG